MGGLHGNHLAKIVPPKQFTSYLLPFLMGLQRLAAIATVVRIQISRQPTQANLYFDMQELYTSIMYS